MSNMNETVLRGRLTDPEVLRAYVAAGSAVITVRSLQSNARFTFRFKRPPEQDGKARPIWAAVLSGQDNETAYTYLGTIWTSVPGTPFALEYKHGRKSRVTEDAASVKAVRWFTRMITDDPARLLAQAEVWHEGRCGRCGRRLTVPESVASGFGPECVRILAG